MVPGGLCRKIFLLCFVAAVLPFFIAGLLFICASSTSITWERTPHPVRRPAFSSHLISVVALQAKIFRERMPLGMNWLFKLLGNRKREYRGSDFSVRIEQIFREA